MLDNISIKIPLCRPEEVAENAEAENSE